MESVGYSSRSGTSARVKRAPDRHFLSRWRVYGSELIDDPNKRCHATRGSYSCACALLWSVLLYEQNSMSRYCIDAAANRKKSMHIWYLDVFAGGSSKFENITKNSKNIAVTNNSFWTQQEDEDHLEVGSPQAICLQPAGSRSDR